MLYWVHPQTREETLMSDEQGIMPGADFPLNSFVGHEFNAHEQPPQPGTACLNIEQTCRQASFQVSDSDEQIVHLTADFEAIHMDSSKRARLEATDLIGTCQSRAKERLAQAQARNDKNAAVVAMEDLVQCVEKGVSDALEKVHEEIAFQATVRKNIAAHLENYTCIDDSLNSTADVHQRVWTSVKDGKTRIVHVKHDRPASRIHVVENFIARDECDAMEAAAAATLHRATVADGKGGSRLSEARKAMQAGIKVPWHLEDSGDPIARLSRRVYDYVNFVLDLDIKENGQEDLMSIQYFGRGMDEKEPDRYMPHCDGDCAGLPHKFGQRMATMVMYCDVATRGGHTNFRNAGVHVKPQFGDAIFFSYIDPQTRLMDTGFTEHSGCPVYEGHKKIVTQWVRLGVDDDNPWDSFNTLGIKLSDLKKLEESEE